MSSICMYVPSSGGGHARYAMELMTALSRHPNRPHLYELYTSQDLDREFCSDDYPIHASLPALRHRKSYSNPAFWIAGRLSHYACREMQFVDWLSARPDIVAVHLQEWMLWMAPLLVRRIRAQGKKVFYTVHNVYPHKYPKVLPKSAMHATIRSACNNCDGLFVHTSALAKKAKQFLGDACPPLHIIPHGIWTVQKSASSLSVPERLGLKKLLFFGQIRSNKGLHNLLDAMPQLRDYKLTIAGDAGEPEYFHGEIMPRIKRLQADGIAIDLREGFLPEAEIGPMFESHSAIVLPYTKGFAAQSGVAFMALAYGLPMISSEAGGLRELLGEFTVGSTFADSTPATIRDAVTQLFEQTRPETIAAEFASAQRCLSWHETAAATIAGYTSEIERRSVVDVHDDGVETTAVHQA